jgi:hypothetical protein
MDPSLTHVHPCKHSVWDFLVGYLDGHMSLFYVSLPHLIVYISEDRALVSIHYHCTLLCTFLRDVKVHEETLGARC